MITQTGIQAIQALVTLARLPEGTYLGARAIAKSIGARPNYLGKLLSTLAREKLVISQKGLRGGFRLARRPTQIRLLDVLEPIEQPTRWSGCFLGRGICSDEDPCSVHVRWSVVKEAYISFLSELSISDLLEVDGGSPRPALGISSEGGT